MGVARGDSVTVASHWYPIAACHPHDAQAQLIQQRNLAVQTHQLLEIMSLFSSLKVFIHTEQCLTNLVILSTLQQRRFFRSNSDSF
jgi:myosin-crossreactive antigen